MEKSSFKIEAFWDADTYVWVANSDDIFELSTEANAIEELVEKLKINVTFAAL